MSTIYLNMNSMPRKFPNFRMISKDKFLSLEI